MLAPICRQFALSLLVFMGNLWHYETDQFTNRHEPIADSREVLNREVNAAIQDIAANWRHGPNQRRFVKAVYWRLGGLHWVDKLERWAMQSPEVARLSTPRRKSIYHGLPFRAVRVAFFFGVGATIKIGGQLIGTDKIGHFFSQGCKFYHRYLKSGSEEKAARRAAYTERAIFGQLTTGSYSNADLVANYEGYRFYRSLFEDDIVPGKSAILRWKEGLPVVQRPFDWADHVNEFWDEALNPNHFDRLLYPHMRKKLLSLCDYYRQYKSHFQIHNYETLAARYAHIGLRDMSELRLDRLCEDTSP